MQIDANMVHGWPPSPCATERVISLWGTLCHHVEPGVSCFIPSTLYALTGYMAKNAPHVGNASAITMQDGRKMFAGSSIAN